MATRTSVGSGNFSAGATWDSNPVIPVDGDAVIIATGHSIAMDQRIPATGSLASLTFQGTGNITVDKTNAAVWPANPSTSGIYVTGDIITGDVVGIAVTGAASEHTLEVVVGGANGAVGGSGSVDHCVSDSSTGPLTITGLFVGGAGVAAFGVNKTAGALAATNCTIKGGAGVRAYGLYDSAAYPVFTNVDLVNSATSMAYAGYPPVWNMSGNANYWQMNVNTGGGNADEKFYAASTIEQHFLPDAANVLDTELDWGPNEDIDGEWKDVDHAIVLSPLAGGSTWGFMDAEFGTYDPKNFFDDVDPDYVVEAFGPWKYESAEDNRTPLYHETEEAEVQKDVEFGPSSSLTGSYEGGGGSGSVIRRRPLP